MMVTSVLWSSKLPTQVAHVLALVDPRQGRVGLTTMLCTGMRTDFAGGDGQDVGRAQPPVQRLRLARLDHQQQLPITSLCCEAVW